MIFEAKRTIVIDKPVDDVWNILWDGSSSTFGDGIAKILSNVKATNKVITEGAVQVDGICGRELAMMDGSVYTEILEKVDKEKHILSYSISGAPLGAVPVGTWAVSKVEGDASKAELTLSCSTPLSYWPPQFLGYPIFALMIPGVYDAMLDDIKHYAETGEPSPAKKASMKKVGASAA